MGVSKMSLREDNGVNTGGAVLVSRQRAGEPGLAIAMSGHSGHLLQRN